MLQSEPQLSADAALLVGLSAAVSVMIGFGLLMYWLMQPTVLLHASSATVGHEKRAPIVLRASLQSPPPDVEQSAITAAERENDIQGLRPIVVARAEPDTSPAQTAANTTAKVSKSKRVAARASRRNARAAFASNGWGGGYSQAFGGYGGWYR
jgi:hypothetical protein